jgi:imidazolonepropionase-like amidohydrolase
MAGRSCMTARPVIRSEVVAAGTDTTGDTGRAGSIVAAGAMTRARRGARSLLYVVSALAVVSCRPTRTDGVALIGATVIDGTGHAPQPDMVVVVRGNRIETVAARQGFEIPRGVAKVDVSGRWIMPGLIDAHAHTAPWTLARYLASGVTTVRDVHGTLDSVLALRERVNLGSVAGPRVYTAGAMLDAVPATYPDAIGVRDANEARKAVDRLAVAGTDYIKVYTHITPLLLRAIVDEAQAFGLRVTAHLGLTDALTAAEIGVRSMEHLSGVPEAAAASSVPFEEAHRKGFFAGWTFFERSWAGLDSAALGRVASRLAERQTILVPTLVLHETFSRLDDPALLRQDSAYAAVPESEMRQWNVEGMVSRAGWTGDDFAAFKRSREHQDLFVREFRRAGGMIAAGTDASNQLLVPGASMHRELELLVAAGLSATEAIAAGTRNGAMLIGADSLGILEAGKSADLLVLTRDPLADIRNTRSVERVMVRGRLMPTDSIRGGW